MKNVCFCIRFHAQVRFCLFLFLFAAVRKTSIVARFLLFFCNSGSYVIFCVFLAQRFAKPTLLWFLSNLFACGGPLCFFISDLHLGLQRLAKRYFLMRRITNLLHVFVCNCLPNVFCCIFYVTYRYFCFYRNLGLLPFNSNFVFLGGFSYESNNSKSYIQFNDNVEKCT